MATPSIIGVLRELLAAEQKSIAPRLMESTVFVSQLSVHEFEALRRAAKSTRENERQLTELIVSFGGSPGPRAADVMTADLHFLEVHFVVPKLLADRETLVRKYTVGAAQLAREPKALAVVVAILERHKVEFAEFGRVLGARTKRAG